MKTKFSIIFLLFGLTYGTAGAQIKKEPDAQQTKMDRFTSRTGAFSKFVDSRLPDLKCNFASPETRVRKIIVGTELVYFYQIVSKGQYSNTTASIEYSDLLEVIKALKVLQSEVNKDMAATPDYLENKFVTTDGFQIGYYVDKGKAEWYIKLDKFGSDSTLFVDEVSKLEQAFNEARAKIEELKKG